MSQIVLEDVYKQIFDDPQLARARSKLSLHEIRLIVRHVRAADEGDKELLGEALFGLSAELKSLGLFDQGETNLTAAYEKVVRALQ